MTGWFWAGLVTGLAANECCDVSEWAARRLVWWSAYLRYEDPERAKIRAEELAAVVASRPGQLLKLITAVCFVVSAIQAWMSRVAAQLTYQPIHAYNVPGNRVLIIVKNLPVPFDRRVWLECRELVSAGHKVTVICPKGDGDPSHQVIDRVQLYKYRPYAPSNEIGFAVERVYSSLATGWLVLKARRSGPFMLSRILIR
ncbi:MAG TPA: hypothetical protein VIY52_26625 [Streptosporangiaceae bacterium]